MCCCSGLASKCRGRTFRTPKNLRSGCKICTTLCETCAYHQHKHDTAVIGSSHRVCDGEARNKQRLEHENEMRNVAEKVNGYRL